MQVSDQKDLKLFLVLILLAQKQNKQSTFYWKPIKIWTTAGPVKNLQKSEGFLLLKACLEIGFG